jgi:predicted O-methyltransferase YrrM
MNRIVLPNVESYMDMLSPQRDQVLTEIETLASNHRIPIVGPAVGRFLFLLTRLIAAKHVFEMGSAVGYSTIWLARAVGENGTVYFTDTGEENARQARSYFKKAGVSKQVKLLVGDAVRLIDTVEGNFDLIFIDLDKKQYPEAFAKAYPRLRRGGLLVTDNVLLFGLVTENNWEDATIEAVREFNRLIYSKDDLFTTILPIRDGVSVSLRL